MWDEWNAGESNTKAGVINDVTVSFLKKVLDFGRDLE
jgi:hypothetical protein